MIKSRISISFSHLISCYVRVNRVECRYIILNNRLVPINMKKKTKQQSDEIINYDEKIALVNNTYWML